MIVTWGVRGGVRRIVPIAFSRATTGLPDAQAPNLDDRGERGPEFGPIVGVTEGATIQVHALRKALPHEVPLFAVAAPVPTAPGSTAALHRAAPFTVEGNAALPSTSPMPIALRGVTGGADSEDGRLEIHAGSAAGPVVAHLTVRVYTRLDLRILYHRVQFISPAGVPGPISAFNPAEVTSTVQTIWGHYGVVVTDEVAPGPPLRSNVQHSTGPHTDWFLRVTSAGLGAEYNPLVGAPNAWMPGRANVYLVPRIGTDATMVGDEPVAAGFGRAWPASGATPHMSIVVSDRAGETGGRTVAHEVGHFLDLEHVGDAANDATRIDPTVFALRQLMHNYRWLRSPDPWPRQPPDRSPWRRRARVDEIGHGRMADGRGIRGTLVTMKSIPHVALDHQVQTIRREIRAGFI